MSGHGSPDLIIQLCRQSYGTVTGFLSYASPFQLLIAVILSAQTTDDQVNRCTPELFRLYPDVRRLARAPLEDLEGLVHATGFFRTKAKNIKAAALYLMEHHEGRVPDTMDELVLIPGVGRKSAGVVLHQVFQKPAIIVDTHFGRVCRRLGFSNHEDPVRLEHEVASLFLASDWGDISMLLNLHGRRVCMARNPRCMDCFLQDQCPATITGS